MDIHFIHVTSSHENALPLIMTHGWPGSVMEMIDSVGPLTDPTAHGGSAEDAFHLVLPSLPGYGFSGEPVEVGWDLDRTARAWAELMRRLGYTRYVAQGGDVGAGVTDAMARQAPEGLIGVHTNLLVPALGGPMPTDTDEERAAAAQIATFSQSGNGYFVEMATRPQTIGYALLDSPVALAAWMIDHDTDAYYKIARAFVDAQPSGNLTRDNVLDNITAYWLTGTGASAARSYWEAYGPDAPAAGAGRLPPPTIPFAFTTFPGEIWRTPRSWVEASYPNVIYFNEVDRGGHFAAWEEPELFAEELRASFSRCDEPPVEWDCRRLSDLVVATHYPCLGRGAAARFRTAAPFSYCRAIATRRRSSGVIRWSASSASSPRSISTQLDAAGEARARPGRSRR